jgi:hypothetical protein
MVGPLPEPKSSSLGAIVDNLKIEKDWLALGEHRLFQIKLAAKVLRVAEILWDNGEYRLSS